MNEPEPFGAEFFGVSFMADLFSGVGQAIGYTRHG